MRIFERLLFRGGRDWVCSQARRDVLEIAVGTGLNLTHYPRDTRLTGIELSPMMLEIARQRLRTLGRGSTLNGWNARSGASSSAQSRVKP